MAKRKRAGEDEAIPQSNGKITKIEHKSDPVYVQIVTGSYERVLHGITVTIPLEGINTKSSKKAEPAATFTDAFLFNAHTSAIKCLALSPPPPPDAAAQKVILATGSSDEKINLFHLSTRPPRGPILPSLSSKTQENPDNKSLGTLHTHDSSITALHFPNRSKLLSACGNNLIAITSTRNFNTLSFIKAPNPKHPNRPTGDTSTPSTLPSGVNDFAVHPSMKLMLSVGKAERCMRLWNLVTGKKAGVLNFDREMLQAVGESSNKWATGEGRRIMWNAEGSQFAVGFQRGICLYGLDCTAQAKVVPSPASNVHQLRYVPGIDPDVLAVSTEDGRILFYSTSSYLDSPDSTDGQEDTKTTDSIPACKVIGQIIGKTADISGRLKDFTILSIPTEGAEDSNSHLIVVAAGSDGALGVWSLDGKELSVKESPTTKPKQTNGLTKDKNAPNVGKLLGSYKTNNRITCLESFVLSGSPSVDVEESNGIEKHGEFDSESEEESENDDDDEDSE